MDGNKRNFFNQRPSVQFKRKGSSINKGKWNNSSREQFSGNSQSLDTVYRILCPSKKIGGVIGKGGGIIKVLREETRSKITVADSVLGSDERVIIIYSSPTKISRKQDSDEDSNKADEQEPMEPHCAAQDALLKVNDRIVEEDLYGGVTFDDDNENIVVTRLLVPNNLVGCLLGKRGDVIQRLRSETCANIRVLPADQLPTCAMDTDELVQNNENMLSTHYNCGERNKKKRTLWSCSSLAIFWVIWMERNRRIFDDSPGLCLEALWERVSFWSALWASVTPIFRNYSLSALLLNWKAAVS